MVLLDSFFVRYALCQSQRFFRQVTLLSRELLKTAKIKRSRIVPQMFPELPSYFARFAINSYLSATCRCRVNRSPSSLETFPSSLHHGDMHPRRFAILLLLASLAFGDIVEDVRTSLAQRNFTGADSELQA